ncbi:6229_t:CDS:2, partial [Funneliformis mosseae]
MTGEFYVENNKEGIEVEGDRVEKAGMERPCTPEDKESRFKESESEEW